MKKSTLLTLSLFFLIGTYAYTLLSTKNTVCANSITCANNLESEISDETSGTFLNTQIVVPPIDLTSDTPTSTVLGENTLPNQKHIYVDLESQKLYAYDGTTVFLETLVSTGRWGKTPTGEFTIWIKIRSQKMSGGSGNDYYYLPNVPYIMFFSNNEVAKSRGFSLHGTYWHNNFGHVMSHGCVNLRTIDAKALYDWTSPTTVKSTTNATTADPGTPITICDQLQIQEGTTPVCLE